MNIYSYEICLSKLANYLKKREKRNNIENKKTEINLIDIELVKELCIFVEAKREGKIGW